MNAVVINVIWMDGWMPLDLCVDVFTEKGILTMLLFNFLIARLNAIMC